MSATWAPTRRTRPRLEVFAATCTGAARVCGGVGLPIVHIDACRNVEAAIDALNARAHGAAVLTPDCFQPLVIESGWDDWAPISIEPGPGDATTPGVELVDGRVHVTLTTGVTLDEFREQLHGGLRHLRLQEAIIRSDFLEARAEAALNYVAHPRYTLREPQADFRGATLCTDLYCIDPAEHGWRLVWLTLAARLSTLDRSRSPWR